MAATIKGIDVSMYQTNVDFAKVKAAGYSFVIIRCNNWDHTKNCVVKDPLFETHYKNAKAAGLDVGAYYYTWQTTVSGAKQDAVLCLDYIKGKTFEYPIYFDLEWQKAFARGKTVCSDMVKTFCTALEEAGYFAGLYISRSPLQTRKTLCTVDCRIQQQVQLRRHIRYVAVQFNGQGQRCFRAGRHGLLLCGLPICDKG